MVSNRARLLFPREKRPSLRLGPRPPSPVIPWQAAQAAAKNVPPASMASDFPASGLGRSSGLWRRICADAARLSASQAATQSILFISLAVYTKPGEDGPPLRPIGSVSRQRLRRPITFVARTGPPRSGGRRRAHRPLPFALEYPHDPGCRRPPRTLPDRRPGRFGRHGRSVQGHRQRLDRTLVAVALAGLYFRRPSAEQRVTQCTTREDRAFSVDSPSGTATLLMLPEQGIKKFLPPAEIRSPEPRERLSKVDHATARCKVKNAKRPGYFESLSPSDCRAFAIVDEDEVGREKQSQRDRRLLAFVQRAQRWIIARPDHGYLKPLGHRAHPASQRRRRGKVAQLVAHNRGDEYLLEQSRQELDLIDLHKVTKRAGVSDYKTHQKPRRCKPSRSRSRSSRV